MGRFVEWDLNLLHESMLKPDTQLPQIVSASPGTILYPQPRPPHGTIGFTGLNARVDDE